LKSVMRALSSEANRIPYILVSYNPWKYKLRNCVVKSTRSKSPEIEIMSGSTVRDRLCLWKGRLFVKCECGTTLFHFGLISLKLL